VAGDAEGDALVHTTAVSLLDRLIHHSVVVVIDGESYRMREARQRGGGRATKKR
jgi:DNA replication protein DnaC